MEAGPEADDGGRNVQCGADPFLRDVADAAEVHIGRTMADLLDLRRCAEKEGRAAEVAGKPLLESLLRLLDVFLVWQILFIRRAEDEPRNAEVRKK